MSGFKAFLLRGNVVDLAIAVVIGVAFGTVVQALIKDLITPLLAAIGGKPDFSALFFTLNHSRFLYGDFIDALLAFILLAAVIYYFVVLPYTRYRGRFEPAPATKECPQCLTKVPVGARKCSACTSSLA
jgi:large conductance mechanosensitive channel